MVADTFHDFANKLFITKTFLISIYKSVKNSLLKNVFDQYFIKAYKIHENKK